MLHLNWRMSCCFSIMSVDVPSLTVLHWESQNSTSKLCVGVRQNEKFPSIPSSFVYATRTFFNFPHFQISPQYPNMGLTGLRGIYSVKSAESFTQKIWYFTENRQKLSWSWTKMWQNPMKEQIKPKVESRFGIPICQLNSELSSHMTGTTAKLVCQSHGLSHFLIDSLVKWNYFDRPTTK